MATDPEVTPHPAGTPETIPIERPDVNFSGVRWVTTGIVRLSYRRWTRVAAFLFPEDSKAERIAQALHIPLPDKLNMSWITTHLAVGGRVHPEDIKALAAAGVTHVVDTRSEHWDDAEALAKEHIELLHLPTADTKPLTIEQMLVGSQWVQERMKQGGRVLIHCEHGVGRSALLACAVLVYDGMSAHDALHLVQQKRWQAAPNHRQVIRLREFESAVIALRKA
jgi:protein-tyrosine phosphatase